MSTDIPAYYIVYNKDIPGYHIAYTRNISTHGVQSKCAGGEMLTSRQLSEVI